MLFYQRVLLVTTEFANDFDIFSESPRSLRAAGGVSGSRPGPCAGGRGGSLSSWRPSGVGRCHRVHHISSRGDGYPLVNIQKAIEAMAIERVDLYLHIPSGYVNIAIENGHRNSEFSHEKWWIFPVRYVSHYQRVYRAILG